MNPALRRYVSAVKGAEFTRRSGSVSQFFGLVVESTGPDAFLGEVCEIYSRATATPINAIRAADHVPIGNPPLPPVGVEVRVPKG